MVVGMRIARVKGATRMIRCTRMGARMPAETCNAARNCTYLQQQRHLTFTHAEGPEYLVDNRDDATPNSDPSGIDFIGK